MRHDGIYGCTGPGSTMNANILAPDAAEEPAVAGRTPVSQRGAKSSGAVQSEPAGQRDHPDGGRISVGRLVLYLGRLQADAGDGPVTLTRLEFLLLKELAENAGRSVSRSELLATVWEMWFDPATNVVDACVHRLRSKLDYDLIRTVRGTGYQVVP